MIYYYKIWLPNVEARVIKPAWYVLVNPLLLRFQTIISFDK